MREMEKDDHVLGNQRLFSPRIFIKQRLNIKTILFICFLPGIYVWVFCSYRHVGDLGNVQADASGNIDLSFNDTYASLTGTKAIMGRAFVVRCCVLLI